MIFEVVVREVVVLIGSGFFIQEDGFHGWKNSYWVQSPQHVVPVLLKGCCLSLAVYLTAL